MASADEYAAWIVKNQDKKGTPEFDTVAEAYKVARSDAGATKAPAAQQQTNTPAAIVGPEVAASLITGGIAAPLAGYAGAAAAAIPGLRPGIGADVVDTVSNALTYKPRFDASQKALDWVSTPFEWLAKKADQAGSATAESTGSPAVGAGVNAAIQAAPAAVSGMFGRVSPVKGPSPAAVAARQAGLSLTPGDMGAGVVARNVSSLSGEPRLAKHISHKNQPVINEMIARDLKLPPDTPLDRPTIQAVRKDAHVPYEKARGLGDVQLDTGFGMALDKISSELTKAEKAFPGRASPVTELVERLRKSKTADADGIVSEINSLRSEATEAYAAGKNDLGRASRAAADALEEQLLRHAIKTKQDPGLIRDMRDARTLIAKTYSAEKALSGNNINPQVYASQLRKGSPLSGEAKAVAEFADEFPRSSLNMRNAGETGVTFADAALGGLTGELKNVLLRPAMRAILGSDLAQGTMMNTPAVLEAFRRAQASPLTGALEMTAEQRNRERLAPEPEPIRKNKNQSMLNGVRG